MFNARALEQVLNSEPSVWPAGSGCADRPATSRPVTQPAGRQTGAARPAGMFPEACMSETAEPDAWSEWNPANFERVIAQYQTRIYRFIYSIVGEAELSRDLTQDTFMSAYRNLSRRAHSTEPETDPAQPDVNNSQNMSAWLYTIARNTALSEIRRRKVVRFLPFLHRPAGQPDDEYDGLADTPTIEPGGNLEARAALRDELQMAMDRVGREKLTALLLHMDGFSYKEICDISGDSLSSVKSQIFRAKESLRRALAWPAAGLLNVEEGRK